MRIVIVGQQAFGKAVLEAFIARGDEIAGVFAAPEQARRAPRPARRGGRGKEAAGLPLRRNTPIPRRRTLARAECRYRRHGLCAAVRAARVLRDPETRDDPVPPVAVAAASRSGLDPVGDHPRPRRDRADDLPSDPGLDEGPVILQKRVAIGPDDTAASLYFDKIFPLGVEALVQAADLVVAGRATEWTQDESQATYEGWVREAEARINWASHVDFVYDLIRGCNPAPGAWTTFKSRPDAGEQKLYLFDAKKIMAPTFGTVRGKKIGEVVSAGPEGLRIHGARRLYRGARACASATAPRSNRPRWTSRSGRYWGVRTPPAEIASSLRIKPAGPRHDISCGHCEQSETISPEFAPTSDRG